MLILEIIGHLLVELCRFFLIALLSLATFVGVIILCKCFKSDGAYAGIENQQWTFEAGITISINDIYDIREKMYIPIG